MGNWLNNIKLEGSKVQLVPLKESHKEGLLRAASDGKLWELWFTSVPSIENIDAYIKKALDDQKLGIGFPFTILNNENGEIIGSTRFCNVVPVHQRLEIGYTWYAKSFQRTGVNTECKYLLLSYAFEKLNCIAVEFRTHWHNMRSKAAISRLGAKQDGVLRNHHIEPDGSLRDTVVFSIINTEWAVVKRSLQYEMDKHAH